MNCVFKFLSLLTIFLLTSAAFAQQTDRDKGIDLYREGKFKEAIHLLEKSVAADETDRAAWTYLGGAYVNIGENDKATKAFVKSKVRPTSAQPKYESSVRVTYKPRATYSEEGRRNLSSGTVRIFVEFRSDGKIGFAFALPSSIDPSLVRQSIEASRGIKFEPAVKNGKPVTVINITEYGFGVG